MMMNVNGGSGSFRDSPRVLQREGFRFGGAEVVRTTSQQVQPQHQQHYPYGLAQTAHQRQQYQQGMPVQMAQRGHAVRYASAPPQSPQRLRGPPQRY